jgi:hypothetical protein
MQALRPGLLPIAVQLDILHALSYWLVERRLGQQRREQLRSLQPGQFWSDSRPREVPPVPGGYCVVDSRRILLNFLRLV